MHEWFMATRPWSLTASAVPVSLGAALAVTGGVCRPGLFLLTLIGGMLLQVGTNLLNTYGDFMTGVDTLASAQTCPQLVTGRFTPAAVRRGGFIALGCAALLGLGLTALSGAWLLAFGLIGILGAYGYTTGRKPYKYLGLGPFLVFWLMGPLMTLPAFYVQTSQLTWAAAWIALPVAFMVAAILYANELRDIEHDRQAGISTLSITLGLRGSLVVYCALLAGAFISLAALAGQGALPTGTLAAAILIVPMVRTIRPLIRYMLDPRAADRALVDAALVPLEGQTAKWHFLFGLLMLAGMLLEWGVRSVWN